MRSSTETLIAACKELAATVQCDDGVANSALREIAERLEELSNDKLIAAAPDLLNACKRYLDAMERYGHPDKTPRLMRSAIEKATGEVTE